MSDFRRSGNAITHYYADAQWNGLVFGRNSEEPAVSTFARSLRQATHEFCEAPLGSRQIPSRNRVISAIPDFFERFLEAVVQDARNPLARAA